MSNHNLAIAYSQHTQPKQQTFLLTGHYGSGKTSIASALAFRHRKEGNSVAICDLDIVNPYFRTLDRRAELEAAGIRVIASAFAGGNLDAPALPRELRAALLQRSDVTILDVGGDDRGALALGRYAFDIANSGAYEMLFVVNFFRPRTQSVDDALAVLREVETACGLKATALVNNSNLGAMTTAEHVRAMQAKIDTLSQRAQLPVAFTAVDRRLQKELKHLIDQPLWLDVEQMQERQTNGKTHV